MNNFGKNDDCLQDLSVFKVGDRVKATNKTSGDEVTMTVTDRGETYLEGVQFCLVRKEWDFRLVERPYVLPTEPGFYSVASSQSALDNGGLRVGYLNLRGEWSNVHYNKDSGVVGRFDEMATQFKWNLKKLSI